MTKITKQIKLQALLEYFNGLGSIGGIAQKYRINKRVFRMLVAAYATHGTNILFNPPKITAEFRIKIAQWAIENDASYTQVAAKFGYTGMFQIYKWKEIYRNEGPNGLLSITKGRKPKMDRKKNNKTKKSTSSVEERLKKLEAENLELRIKNEALKLLASMKQQTKKSPK